ncbi:thioredoxin-disulfide reductase [Spirochaeta dissipatitropha]
MENTRKVIIIGSGPAAHTAAIYAARAEMKPLLFEGFMAGGVAAGGQLTTTTEVDNFPGFPEGISGPELMDNMRKQSIRFGTEIKTETVSAVDTSSRPFRVTADSGEYLADAVIVATGATARRLDLPGEDRLWQRGISACAVCDGALPLFRNQPLVVIGGGDSAAEEASFLTKYGSSVTLLVRRDEMRASKAMQKRVFNNEKIQIMWKTQAVEVRGEKMLEEVLVRNSETGEETLVPAKGLFYAVGHTPNTDFLGNALDTDDAGYIQTIPGTTRTNIPGIFACGDVQDKHYRQAISAAGSGCMAALDAEKFLAEQADA